MAGRNFLCGQESCDQPAYMFGLVGGGVKLTVCREHLFPLTDKGVPVFEIAAYQFIESADDYSLYLLRKAQMERGLGNITALESRCEADLYSIQGLIETTKASVLTAIEKVFQELHLQSMQYSTVLKQKLYERRLQIEQLTKDKNYDLSPEDAIFCASVPSGPLIKLALEERSENLTSLLRAHHRIDITDSGMLVEPKLPELSRLRAVLAESNEAESKRNRKQRFKAAKQILCQFSTVATEENVKEVVQWYVKGAVEATQTGAYAQALKKLERGQSLLQQWYVFDPLLYLQISDVRAYYGEWTQAEEILKQGLHLLQTEPTSIVILQLSNSLIELYHQRELYEGTVELGEWTLNTWGNTQHSFELLRALFFLTDACYCIDEEIKGFKWADLYTVKFAGDDGPSNCVLFFIRANKLYINERYQQAVEQFEKGMMLSQQLSSHAYLTMFARLLMGRCYSELKQYDQTKVVFTDALHLYRAYFPQSQTTFSCIGSLISLFYFDLEDSIGAEAVINEFIEFFSFQFPKSLGLPICIKELGSLYWCMGKYVEADKQYQQAIIILSAHFPSIKEYADCLCCYGDSLKSREQGEHAKEQYMKAFPIYLSLLPESSGIISCLESIAEVEDRVRVEALYLQAHNIYSSLFPKSRHFVTFLQEFGEFYKKNEQYERVEKAYLTTHLICIEHFPQTKKLLDCLIKLGDFYKEREEYEKSEVKYLAAQSICYEHFPSPKG